MLRLATVLPVLADDAPPPAAIAMILGIACVAIVISLGIQAIICWYLSGVLKAIPAEHRKQQPNMVWLLMIPVANIVLNFFVYPKIAESFQSNFASIGRSDVGDAGKSLSMWFCILVCTSIIPYLGSCTGLAAFVIWIMLLVKFAGYKKEMPATALPGTGAIQ